MDQTWNSFDTKVWPQWKDWKSIYQVKQNLALFCELVPLILGWNCVKGQSCQKIKFEGAWGKLQAKNRFQRQPWTKCLRKTLVFIWNSALRDNFNFYFSEAFCWYQQNSSFGSRTGHYVMILRCFEIFLIFPNFLRS